MNHPREDLHRLASYVVDARIKAGFPTRKEFAAATGVTARTLGKLETGSERVSSDTLARVASALHWTPDSPALVMAGSEPVAAARAPGDRLRPVGAAAAPAKDEVADKILADLQSRYRSREEQDVVLAMSAQQGVPAGLRVMQVLRFLKDPELDREVLAWLVSLRLDDDPLRVVQAIGSRRGPSERERVTQILEFLDWQPPALEARNGTAG